MIAGSCSPSMLSINERSNVGKAGRWVFRVDNSQIETSGISENHCQKYHQSNGSAKLKVSPTTVNAMSPEVLKSLTHHLIRIYFSCKNDPTKKYLYFTANATSKYTLQSVPKNI